MLDLDNARKVIAAEKCRYLIPGAMCGVHGGHEMSVGKGCDESPEVADVAADLLAAVERVQALADELETTNTAGRLIGKSIRDRLEGTDNA